MTHRFVRCLILPSLIAAAVFTGGMQPAHAQRLSSSQFKNGSAVRRVFKSVVAEASKATVAILSQNKQLALGAIVDPEGYILTKASELKGALQCQLRNGKHVDAHIIGVSQADDLALLKIDANELQTVEWRTGDDPKVGQWLATPGLEATPVSVGVLSVQRRKIPAQRPLLGVSIEDNKFGARIVQITPNSGAAKAGLKVGDIITWIAGTTVKDRTVLSSQIRRFRPGDTLQLKIRRKDSEVTMKARLGTSRNPKSRGAIQNRMGGELSERREGFPIVLQHDGYLRPQDCGGPIVDLNGRVVGINIARGGRTNSYTIPVDRILTLLPDLRSGKLAPPKAPPQQAPAPPLPENATTSKSSS